MTTIFETDVRFRTRTDVKKSPQNEGGFSAEMPLLLRFKHFRSVMNETKLIIRAIEEGEPKAAEQLLTLVYEELRRLASRKLASNSSECTLQPTALVHEAWLKLVGDRDQTFQNRAHFFRAAAVAMRHILIDRARRKQTQRHGGGYVRIDLEGIEPDLALSDSSEKFLALNEALDKYSKQFPIQAELVNLKYFAGMTNEEVSLVLNISISTAKNYWNFSRAWLLNEIEKG
jgi:RNA polymerase sigma factor (TIGR02999 family)